MDAFAHVAIIALSYVRQFLPVTLSLFITRGLAAIHMNIDGYM